MKQLTEVNDLYLFRYNQIMELHRQIYLKGESSRVSLSARNLDEADIMFMGYMNRFKNLNTRLCELEQDYRSVQVAMTCSGFIGKVLSIFSLVYINRETKQKLNIFLSKWKDYEPGW